MKTNCLAATLAVTFLALAPSVSLQARTELTRLVPASAPVVLHVRNMAELRTAWTASSYARAWQDPEIRRFLAPTIDAMNSGDSGMMASIKRDTGMAPEEFFALFNGEAIFAIKDFSPYFSGRSDSDPQLFLAVECGSSAAKIQDVIKRAAARSEGASETEEEFQGETLHVTLKAGEDGARTERQAWAIVDGVFMMGEPKAVLQAGIVALKKGGVAEPIAEHPALASLYRKSPDTHVVAHLGLDGIIAPMVAALETPDAEGNPTGPAAQLARFGLTPGGFVKALGLDALRSIDVSAAFRERETVIEGDLAWTAKRGLLRLSAMGEPPVPRPDFIPDSWVSVGVDNFSLREAYAGLMATIADISPMIDGMVRQNIKNLNTQLKIDLERDLVGSFGDVMVSGHAVPAGAIDRSQPLDQFYGIALSNAAAFRSALDAILAGTPAGQMVTPREYLGETIRVLSLPNGKSAAIAVTRDYLLVSTGGPAMVESAIQGLQGGAAKSFWKKAGVDKALASLPDGASSVMVSDVGRVMSLVVDFLAENAAATPSGQTDDEAPEGPAAKKSIQVDPSARPSPETISKYWSTMARGIYRSPNGIHLILKLDEGR